MMMTNLRGNMEGLTMVFMMTMKFIIRIKVSNKRFFKLLLIIKLF